MKRKGIKFSLITATFLFGNASLFASADNSLSNTQIVGDSSGVHINETKKDSKSGASINPSENGIKSKAFFENDNYRLELELKSAINKVDDTRVKASFALLHAGAKQGTYISVEKGTDLEKLALAYNIAVSGGKIKLSYAFLEKVVEATFSEVSKTYEPKMKQNSYGLDFTKPFEKGNIIRELTTSVIYHDVEDKHLGKLGDIIKDTATEYEWHEVHGGVRGGSKIVADASVAFELHETFRADLTLGYENIEYNKFEDFTSKTESGLTAGVGATYLPNEYNKFKIAYNDTRSGDEYKTSYSHQFSKGIEGFVEGTYKKGVNGIDTNRRVFVGVKMAIGGEYVRNKYSKLFVDSNTTSTLSFQELTANSKVETDYIQVHEALSWKDRIVYIDKTALGAGDSLDKNPDGTLKALLLDNGGFAVTAITGISDNSYSAYLSVIGGQLAIVDFVGLNNKMAQDGLTTGQTKALNVSVTDASGASVYAITLRKGSVEITSTVQREFNVTPVQASAFVAGTKTITEIKTENGGADTTPNAFDIPNLTAQTINTVVTTSAITVAGINAAATVTTTVGTLVIDGIDTGLTSTTVNNGQTVAVKLTTSGSYSTAVNGTVSIGGVSDTFSVVTEGDTEKPTTPTLSINGGATHTNSTTVNISITGDTDNVGVTGWYVSESSTTPALGDFVAEPATATISAGDGLKTLYVWTRDAAGNISNVASDTITLDTVAPSSMSFEGTTPNTQGTPYNGLTLNLGEDLTGGTLTSLTSSTGGTITGESINGGNIMFNWTTPNSSTALTAIGKDRAGNDFSVTLNVTLN